MEEILGGFIPTTPQGEVMTLFEKYTHLSSTPPSPTSYERYSPPTVDSDAVAEAFPPPAPICYPSLPTLFPISLPPIPPLRPLPPPYAPPGTLPPSLSSPIHVSWSSRISSVYRIKLLVARLAAFRIIKPFDPSSPTRRELVKIHEIIHYIRGIARHEDAIELERDHQASSREETSEKRIRNVQIVTLFRILRKFHPDFLRGGGGGIRSKKKKGEEKLMRMVQEAVDDERDFEDLFKSNAFTSIEITTKKRPRPRYREDSEEEEEEEYLPVHDSSKRRKKNDDPAFEGKKGVGGGTRQSLRTQLLTRSMKKNTKGHSDGRGEAGGSQNVSMIKWD